MIKELIISTPLQKTLAFLAQNPRAQFHVREIGRRLPDCSLSSIKRALRDLAESGLVDRERVGRNVVNRLDSGSIAIKIYRILSNVLDLHELVNELKERSVRVVLFGSRADGTNDAGSDFDLLIVSSDPGAARSLVQEHRLRELISAVILTPSEMINLPRDNNGLYEEIQRGLTLWQKE